MKAFHISWVVTSRATRGRREGGREDGESVSIRLTRQLGLADRNYAAVQFLASHPTHIYTTQTHLSCHWTADIPLDPGYSWHHSVNRLPGDVHRLFPPTTEVGEKKESQDIGRNKRDHTYTTNKNTRECVQKKTKVRDYD